MKGIDERLILAKLTNLKILAGRDTVYIVHKERIRRLCPFNANNEPTMNCERPFLSLVPSSCTSSIAENLRHRSKSAKQVPGSIQPSGKPIETAKDAAKTRPFLAKAAEPGKSVYRPNSEKYVTPPLRERFSGAVTAGKKNTEWRQDGRRIVPIRAKEQSPVRAVLHETRWSSDGRRKDVPEKKVKAPSSETKWGLDGRRIRPAGSTTNPATSNSSSEGLDKTGDVIVRIPTNPQKTPRPQWMIAAELGISFTEETRQKDEGVLLIKKTLKWDKTSALPTIVEEDEPSTDTTHRPATVNPTWMEEECETSFKSPVFSNGCDLFDSATYSLPARDSLDELSYYSFDKFSRSCPEESLNLMEFRSPTGTFELLLTGFQEPEGAQIQMEGDQDGHHILPIETNADIILIEESSSILGNVMSVEDHCHDIREPREEKKTNQTRSPIVRLTNSQKTIRPAWMKLPSTTAKPMSLMERIRLAQADGNDRRAAVSY